MRLIKRISVMCDPSREILVRTLQLSCALLFCAVVLIINSGQMTAENYATYLLIDELYRMPQALLIVASIASVIVEDFKVH